MTIAIGSDHGGVELKDFLVQLLQAKGIEVEDMGTNGNDSVDYPDFGRLVALRVAKGEVERGILICTNGIGMSILANKFPGEILDIWLKTPFAGGRHQRRIDKITEVERELGTRIKDKT
ncbi:MAG: RpiB/LacA/LacB family sugar-phosphate isomerase [Deltaproteobacteria bacterium]|nr:RpiB/LacA/LacB family sugar-phosphate isomerase [Deltaproteobacteria bacterium]